MPSKFLVPLELPDFQGTPLSTADAGYVLLFIKYGWLTSQLPDGTQVDLVLQRPLDGFTEVDRYANPVVATDTVLGAIEKIQRSLSTLKLQGDVTGTAAYVGGELVIETTGGGGIDCTELLNCQVIIDLDGRISTLENAPTAPKVATELDTYHFSGYGTQYEPGDLVYYQGHIYSANLTNDGVTPAIGGNVYWTDLGVGNRLRQILSDWNATAGEAQILNKPTALSQFTNDAGFITSFTETDPVFAASASAAITSTDITNWNTAYGWGDHSTAGYLLSEADTLDSVVGRGDYTDKPVTIDGRVNLVTQTGSLNSVRIGHTDTPVAFVDIRPSYAGPNTGLYVQNPGVTGNSYTIIAQAQQNNAATNNIAGYFNAQYGATNTAIRTDYGNNLLNALGGNLLVGTIVDAGFKLDVNGSVRFGQYSTSGTIEFYPDGGSTGTYTVFKSRLGSSTGPIVAFYGDVAGTYKGYALYGPDVSYDGLLLYRETGTYAESILLGVDKIVMPNTQILAWSSTGLTYETVDVALARNAANVLEVNSGTAGSFAKLKLKNAIINDLVGGSTRMVVADANGELNTQPLPSSTGTVTSVALATGATGTDINVSGSPITSSGTITLNIPDASATSRGVITTGTQTIVGQKTFRSLTTIFDSTDSGTFIEGRASGVLYGGIVFGLFMQYNAYPAATQGFIWKNGAGNNVMALEQSGVLTVQNLAGTGTRMVVASSTGVLSTQAIPTGNSGTVTSVALATGTTGSDVNVSGSPITGAGTITLNIPDASTSARGLITTGTQTITGRKTFDSPHRIITTDATLTDGNFGSYIGTTFAPPANRTDRNLYGERNSMALDLTLGTLTGSSTFNVTAQYNEVFLAAGGGSTQPIRAMMTALVGTSGKAAMNVADFRFMEIKTPDSGGVTGHVVTTATGLYINDIRSAPGYTITDAYAIYQAGTTDIVYIAGNLRLPSYASPSGFAFLLTDTSGGVASQMVTWDYVLSTATAPFTSNHLVDGAGFSFGFDALAKFTVNSVDDFISLIATEATNTTAVELKLWNDGLATLTSNNTILGYTVAIEIDPATMRLKTPRVTQSLATTGQFLKLVNATTGEVEFDTVSGGSGGGIALTDLSATSPLQYNNTTGVFSILQASSIGNGFLSSTDWNTFNGKQNALVSGTNIKTINGDSILGSGNELVLDGDRARYGYEYFNDFLNSVTVSNGTDGIGLIAFFSGTGTSLAPSSVPAVRATNQHGFIQPNAGTTNIGVSGVYSTTTTSNFLITGGGEMVFETSIFVPTLSDATNRYRIIIGYGSTAGNAAEVNGVFFTYDEGGTLNGSVASANWQCLSVATSVRTQTTTTVAVTTSAWVKLRIVINAAGNSAQYFIDNMTVAVATHSTNIPTGASQSIVPKIGIQKAAGTTSRTFFADYISYRQTYTNTK